MMKYIPPFLFLVLSIWGACTSLLAQNLLANGDFEDSNICKEYGATCAPEAWFRIPPTDVNVNARKVEMVRHGKYAEVIVMENRFRPKNYRVHLYTMLLCPLQKDSVYQLRFYLNTIFQQAYELGVLFSEEELISGVINPLGFEPSLKIIGKHRKRRRNKEDQWILIEREYRAKGGEKFLTLGNFNQEAIRFSKKVKTNNSHGDLIYLIDQISLEAKNKNTPIPCDLEKVKKLLYDNNHRHTNKLSLVPPREKMEVAKLEMRSENLPTPISALSAPKPSVRKKFEIPDIAFDFDQHTIRTDYFQKLDSLLTTIKALHPKKIEIVGHTDDLGTAVYNLRLSTRRAESVKAYLLHRYQDFTGELAVQGKGESEPKVLATTAAQRAQNRRVEIFLSF